MKSEYRVSVFVFSLITAYLLATNLRPNFLQLGELIVAWYFLTFGVYVFNALTDVEEDRIDHPSRPIASGKIPLRTAWFIFGTRDSHLLRRRGRDQHSVLYSDPDLFPSRRGILSSRHKGKETLSPEDSRFHSRGSDLQFSWRDRRWQSGLSRIFFGSLLWFVLAGYITPGRRFGHSRRFGGGSALPADRDWPKKCALLDHFPAFDDRLPGPRFI
jgi:hypothetical protein